MLRRDSREEWPELPYAAWRETYATLHLWTQIIGKIRLAMTPWLNHSWHVVLYVSARGLATSPIPHRDGTFQIEFDFIEHLLRIENSRGMTRRTPLCPRSVADFYSSVIATLAELGVDVKIDERPNEIPDPVTRFSEDRLHCAYDREYAFRFWKALVRIDEVLKLFRTGFIGKCSPVHFFWGSFDLAVTRFSGRRAPLHPGGVPNLSDEVVREAYSHEVSSAGFWPGTPPIDYPAFYSYAYPSAEGFGMARVRPEAAFFSKELGEFVLPYDDVRKADAPDAMLLEFLTSTYEAAAVGGGWDRASLECPIGSAGVPRPIS